MGSSRKIAWDSTSSASKPSAGRARSAGRSCRRSWDRWRCIALARGVLLTTSTLSPDALDYVNRSESKKVVLIDSATLSDLMADYNIGVSVAETHLVKRVDLDWVQSVHIEANHADPSDMMKHDFS